MPALLSSREVVARKAHACQTCGIGAIAVGERYVRDCYVYDGRAYTWVQCVSCSALAGIVYEWCGAPDEGIDRDDYYTWATECLDDPEWGEPAASFLTRSRAVVPEGEQK